MELKQQMKKSRDARTFIIKSMWKHYRSRLRSGFGKWLLFTHNIRYDELEDNISTRVVGAKQLVVSLYLRHKYKSLIQLGFLKWSRKTMMEKLDNIEETMQVKILQAEERGWEEARVSIEKHFCVTSSLDK